MASDGKRIDGSTGGSKPAYEPPVMLPLGEMAKGVGAFCSLGGNPHGVQGVCTIGGAARGRCGTGSGGH